MNKISKIFTYNNIKLYPVEDAYCDDCCFYDGYRRSCDDKSLLCKDYERSDGKSVIFKILSFKFGR